MGLRGSLHEQWAIHGQPDFLECVLAHAAIDAERSARCCRGERTRDVGDKTSHLLRCGEAFERGWTNLLEEIGFEFLEAFAAALR